MLRLNPAHIKAVMEIINHGPFFKHLSISLKEIGKVYSLVELDMGKAHQTPFGAIHGGVYASAIDTATYWALYCEIEEDVGMISLDLNIDFLAPVNKGNLFIEGQSIKVGRSICLSKATAMDGDGKWLSQGSSKLMVGKGFQSIQEAVCSMGSTPLPPKFL